MSQKRDHSVWRLQWAQAGLRRAAKRKLLNLVDAASADTRADIGDGKGAARKTCKDQRGVFGSVIAAALSASGSNSDKESDHESKGKNNIFHKVRFRLGPKAFGWRISVR